MSSAGSTPSSGENVDLYARQYQALAIWGRTREVSPGERARIDTVVTSIPAGTKTILDVGCGDGLVANELLDRGYEITGDD